MFKLVLLGHTRVQEFQEISDAIIHTGITSYKHVLSIKVRHRCISMFE